MESERVIPLTPYVSHLLAALPRRNEFVFSGAAGAMSKPHKPHVTACAVAGIDGLTLYGLRRSLKRLTEWLEVPDGLAAQVMATNPARRLKSITRCARLTCCAYTTKKLKHGFWNRPGLCSTPKPLPVRFEW